MSRFAGCRDDVFGPQVRGCSRFDFTLLFEDTVLSILPSCCFLIVGFSRLWHLSRKPRYVKTYHLRWLKLITLIIYAVLQFASLIALAVQSQQANAFSLASFAISAVCALLLCMLSPLEHSRSVRPATILVLYLSLTSLLDFAKVRTLWYISTGSTVTILFTTCTAVKCLAFLLETLPKSSHVASKTNIYSPEETCGIISLSLSLWLWKVLRRGLKWQISLSHLDDLGYPMSAEQLETSFTKKWHKMRSGTTDSTALLLCCANVLKWPLLNVVPLRIIQMAFTLCQPLLLQSLLQFLKGSNQSRNTGNGLIGAYVLVYLGMALSHNLYWYYHTRTITKLRSILTTAIGSHTLVVNAQLLEDPKSPLTLMSNDVERAVQGIRWLHEVWASLVQACIAIYILERQTGVACVVPVGVTLTTAFVLTKVTSSIGGKQVDWMKATEERITATTSLLASIKSIKMKGLERVFEVVIENLRFKDVECGNNFRRIIAYAGILSFVPEFLSPVIIFVVLATVPAIAGSAFDATKIFTIFAALLVLTQPLAEGLQVLPGLIAGIGSLNRIGCFLLKDKQHDPRTPGSQSNTYSSDSDFPREYEKSKTQTQVTATKVKSKGGPLSHDSPTFRIAQGTFRWGDKDDTIVALDISVPQGKLTTILGPVGCGKTTLCETFLGQTQRSSGVIYTQLESAQIAYCSQTPHLTNSSVKDNIVAFSPYDHAWYNKVIVAVRLWDEVSRMPDRDNTVVGSNGSKLSGGQRQRLAIARAVYSRKDTMILDDCFSGQDNTNARRIFDNLLGPAGLLRERATTVILVTHSREFLSVSDHTIVFSSDGKVVKQGSYGEIISQQEFSHYTAAVLEETNEPSKLNVMTEEEVPRVDEAVPENPVRRLNQADEWKIYSFYAKATGILQLGWLVFVSIAGAAFYSYSSLWLKRWADYTAHSGSDRNGYFLGLYAMFQVLTVIFLYAVATHSLTNVAAHSGRSLHTILLRTVLNSPVAWLTAKDSGHIVNRFSQDIQLIDSELPMALMNLVVCLATAISQGIIIVIASPWTGLAFLPLIVILYGIQKFYLRTSKQIRILDLESKSPLQAHFLDMVSGLSTIRAFGWASEIQRRLHDLLDSSQKPFYFLFMIQNWLNLSLGLVIAIIAIAVVALAVTLGSRGSSIGVALVQIISLSGMLRQSIVAWTQLETSIAAVTRIKEFSDETESEYSNDKLRGEPPEAWPSRGKIEFVDVSAGYRSCTDRNVLHNINLSIPSGEKVGLCGRSGSGKSSLAQTLFGMINIASGSITIDGIDLNTIPLQEIRTRLTAIPQDPSFIPGSIRLNLAPSGDPAQNQTMTDETIMAILEKVKLNDVITKQGGLDAQLQDNIFSHGQRQLFSLASALLRQPSKVVVLDEFTSNVDKETDDQIMQNLIKEAFSDATMIIIAHRLETILSCDRVVVLDQGRIIEIGAPNELIARGTHHSAFARLIDEKRLDKDEEMNNDEDKDKGQGRD